MTADHGQVDVADRIHRLAPDVSALVALQSGEGRFRWLHAVPGAADALFDAATEAHGDLAWVVSLEQVVDEGWFGPVVTSAAAGRLGDVALVAREAVAFDDPADTGPVRAREPSWLGDERRDARPPARRARSVTAPDPRGDADVRDADDWRSTARAA